MKNKVLIKLIVPEINYDFDIFIPVNEQIWKIKKLIIKSISDMVGIQMDSKNGDVTLLNKSTGKLYNNNEIVINTDIRNSTELLMISNMNK